MVPVGVVFWTACVGGCSGTCCHWCYLDLPSHRPVFERATPFEAETNRAGYLTVNAMCAVINEGAC